MGQRWNGPGTDRENAMLAFESLAFYGTNEPNRAEDALRKLVGRDKLVPGDFTEACTILKCAIIDATETEPQAVRQLRQQLRDQRAMIEELLWAMHLWGQDEGEDCRGVHGDAIKAFFAAAQMAGVPHGQTPGNIEGYWLDLDWVERQRNIWAQRNQS